MTATRGAVFRGPRRRLAIEPLELDEPGPGEVQVRMVASGICHSDLHVVDGEWARPADVVLGHEGAAVVERLGDGVAERSPALREGALVVLAWTAPCGRCAACARGEGWACPRPLGAGHRLAPEDVRLRRPDGTPVGAYSGIGTFGERQVVAAEAAIPVDPRTPVEVAALIGCAVATGVGAVRRTARVGRGESIAILGLGGVGLSAVLGAVAAGAGSIVAIDSRPGKLRLAAELGATGTVLVGAGDWPALARVAGPAEGFDHAIECAGRIETAALALQLVRPGGTVTLVGMPPQADRLPVDVYRFVDTGTRLLGSNYGSSVPAEAFPQLADLHLAGRLPVDRLVSERIGLGDVNDALDALRRGEGARRVIVY